MINIHHLIFGQSEFPSNQEIAEFRYRFLIVLMLSASVVTLVFIISEYANLISVGKWHLLSMKMFSFIAFASWLALRRNRNLLYPIAWVYEIACLFVYSSALWLVPEDELRILWFFVNIPGVFIIFDILAGWIITIFSIAFIVGSNSYMTVPYSDNALASTILSMVYLGAFFHAYGARSLSYFIRMQAYNRDLENLARNDPLTGVLNARAYYTSCKNGIGLAGRSGTKFSILFIDIDHFKRVNDTFGHHIGDVVLKEVCDCIARSIRSTDLLGRVGGEELSVFLPSTGAEGAEILAENIRFSIERLCPVVDGKGLEVTASIGLATSKDRGCTLEDIQRKADSAMYAAKSKGRNCVCVYTSPTTPEALNEI